MTAPRPGMTLIELVAALALLVIIVTAALPVLQHAGTTAQPASFSIAIEEIGILADRVVKDPAAFNIKTWEEIDRIIVEWPADLSKGASSAPVVLEKMHDEDSDYAWLRFSVGDLATLRWVALEQQP